MNGNFYIEVENKKENIQASNEEIFDLTLVLGQTGMPWSNKTRY